MRLPLVVALWALAGAAAAVCPPGNRERDELLALKAAEFRVEDAARREALALGLFDCLADPDPQLRDGVAFEALATWMRSDQLTESTRRGLLQRLVPRIGPAVMDADGFRQPFAALVLSEVARTDRFAAWMSAEERAGLVDAAAAYLASVRDYRGFDAQQGWRHGVAHGADLALQLALNPAVDKPQLDRLLESILAQVAPAGEHFYRYGEPERLARPVLYIAQRGLHSEAEWKAWFERVVPIDAPSTWSDAYTTQSGLARRHNTMAFLLYVFGSSRDNPGVAVQALAAPALAALQRLP
jgi:hypothetical protein